MQLALMREFNKNTPESSLLCPVPPFLSLGLRALPQPLLDPAYAWPRSRQRPSTQRVRNRVEPVMIEFQLNKVHVLRTEGNTGQDVLEIRYVQKRPALENNGVRCQ